STCRRSPVGVDGSGRVKKSLGQGSRHSEGSIGSHDWPGDDDPAPCVGAPPSAPAGPAINSVVHAAVPSHTIHLRIVRLLSGAAEVSLRLPDSQWGSTPTWYAFVVTSHREPQAGSGPGLA